MDIQKQNNMLQYIACRDQYYIKYWSLDTLYHTIISELNELKIVNSNYQTCHVYMS